MLKWKSVGHADLIPGKMLHMISHVAHQDSNNNLTSKAGHPPKKWSICHCCTKIPWVSVPLVLPWENPTESLSSVALPHHFAILTYCVSPKIALDYGKRPPKRVKPMMFPWNIPGIGNIKRPYTSTHTSGEGVSCRYVFGNPRHTEPQEARIRIDPNKMVPWLKTQLWEQQHVVWMGLPECWQTKNPRSKCNACDGKFTGIERHLFLLTRE